MQWKILCPLQVRKALITSGEYERVGASAIAEHFTVPVEYITEIFEESYIEMMETLL